MLYPANFENKIGFDQVRTMILERCLCELGRAEARAMAFSSDPEIIFTALAETGEMKDILQFEENFPSQDYYDMTPELNRIRIEGTYLEPETMSELKLSLEVLAALARFFEKRGDRYQALFRIVGGVVSSFQSPVASKIKLETGNRQLESGNQKLATDNRQLITTIALIIDDHANIRSNASPELQKIRREKTFIGNKVEKKAIELFKVAKQSGWTPDDAEVTLRNGRPVIPLRSAHKRKLSGFVQDESSTGHTVYVEPAELLEMNNELRELERAERREIIRILTAFANTLRPSYRRTDRALPPPRPHRLPPRQGVGSHRCQWNCA